MTGGGSGPWVNVQGFDQDYLDTSVIISPLTEGNYYFFRYRVRNVHGWSEFSPISYILMANKPDQLAPVQTINNGVNVDIVWQSTPFDRNSQVFEYRIMIQRSDGSLQEHIECDGMDSDVIQNNMCSISMKSLFEGNFLLV
jgi:hypothetical protein